MHYLFFDCETTGLDDEVHSLLTAYFGIYDTDFNLIDDLDLQIKPNTKEGCDKIIVTKEAMEITGINLEEHLADPQTVTYEKGKEKVLALFEKHKIPRKRNHYTPSGHNIQFDIGFLWKQMIPKENWEKYCHYGKKIDTYPIVTFLQDIGYLPMDLGKLTSLVDYFNIPMGQAHNAREDIKMNVEVYKKIRELMNKKKLEIANANHNSLLGIIER